MGHAEVRGAPPEELHEASLHSSNPLTLGKLSAGHVGGDDQRRCGVAARFLMSYPCNDACCEVMTEHTVEGAPVYRCPGCDSEWIELAERTATTHAPVKSESAGVDIVHEAAPPRLPGGE